MEKKSNNTITLLEQDFEGITEQGGGGKGGQPYAIDFFYGIEKCKLTLNGTVEEPNPNYKDPSDPDYDPDDQNQKDEYITVETTETIGIKDTASLQSWLAGLEQVGCKLWKRKAEMKEGDPMQITVGWQEATATDFEVVDVPNMNSNNIAFKAIDDELIDGMKALLHADTAQAIIYAHLFGWQGLKITHETGANKTTTWHCEVLQRTDYITNNFTIGVNTTTDTLGSITAEMTMENNACVFDHWD